MKNPNRTTISGRTLAHLVSSILVAALLSGFIRAQESVNIAWDAHPDPGVAGYTVYLGTQSGQYSSVNDVASATSTTLNGLAPSTTYYCAVQVYSSDGLSSELSPELEFTTTDLRPEIAVENSTGTNLSSGGSTLVYPSTIPETSSWPQSIILCNEGTSDLTGLEITIEGQNSASFSAASLETSTLPPGASTSVDIFFNPNSTGSHLANLRISSNDADENPFTISLSGTSANSPVPSDYDNWADTYPGVSDPNADSDGDGILNSEERIWGLDPTSGASSSPYLSPLDQTTGMFRYSRRNPGLTGLRYRYEYSTSLNGDWTAFTPIQESAKDTSPVETVDVTVDAALLSNPKFFIRIAVD